MRTLNVAVALLVVGLSGVLASSPAGPAAARPAPPSPTAGLTATTAASGQVSARALLSRLTVRPETGGSTYDRAKFHLWIDADHDGCDTREEVLIKESTRKVKVGSGCSLTGGRWVSWYDGVVTRNPSTFDIDHVVPLHEAWVSGARSWGAGKRERYANDLGWNLSLDAVTAHSNRSKGDRDPAGWLPTDHPCRYAHHWVKIKYRWGLTIDAAEKGELSSLLSGSCGRSMLAVPSRAT